jgi:SAM-dependent methyltransferase
MGWGAARSARESIQDPNPSIAPQAGGERGFSAGFRSNSRLIHLFFDGVTAIALELPAKGVLTPNNEHDPLPHYYRPGIGWLYRHRLNLALDFLEPGGSVLEIGVGSGVLVPTLTRHFQRYLGTDLVLAANLERLAHRECAATFRSADILDAESLPADEFDAIVCISVLEHIANSDAAARTLARSLKKGGLLVTGYPMVSRAMTKAFELIGYHGIDDHHVSQPVRIARSLNRVLRPMGRRAFPPLAPVPLALYQVTAWTK